MRNHDDSIPPELAAIDAALRDAQVEPRASLGPEIAGRFVAGERAPGRPLWVMRAPLRFLAVALGAAALFVFATLSRDSRLPQAVALSTTDRCCEDLDGGGIADDGVLVESVQGQAIRRLVLYEDRSQLGHWSPESLVRFERLGGPTISTGHAQDGLVTREVCCGDYDGGTDKEDGVLIVSSAQGDVIMAAVFERPGSLGHMVLR